MNPTVLAALAALTLVAAPSAGLAHDHHHRSSSHQPSRPTIVGVAGVDANFSTLVTAVQTAGLVDTLNGDVPFTVFAPTNAAFAELPGGTVDRLLEPRQRDQLIRVLTYHVVPGRISARDLVGAVRAGGGRAELTTVQGAKLIVTSPAEGRLRLTDAKGMRIDIVTADVRASNGLIHAIDGVLMPN